MRLAMSLKVATLRWDIQFRQHLRCLAQATKISALTDYVLHSKNKVNSMSNISQHSNPRILQLINEIQLEPLQPSHIEDIARLHYRLLSWSFNGQFGLDHMIEMYGALCKSPYFFGYVYYSNGNLLGFVTATTNFEDTRRFVLGVYKRKIFQTLGVFLRNPRFLLTALESKLLVPIIFRRFGVKSEWLTFVADTSNSYLSPLVALRMIDVVRDHFRTAGEVAYMAQGFKNNPRAMRMYKKLNWRVVVRLPIHNIYYWPTDCKTIKPEEVNIREKIDAQ